MNYITQDQTFDFNTIDIDKEYCIQIQGNAKLLNSWLGSGVQSIPTSAIVTNMGRGGNAGVVWCTAYDGSFCYIRTKFESWRVWKQVSLT